MKKTCIFLLHGSRRPRKGEIESIISKVNLPSYFEKHIAYLELQEPAFSDCLSACEDSHEVHILPLFVLEGRHVREDIPEITEELEQKAPEKKFIVHPHIGEWDLFSQMLGEKVASL